MSIDNPQPEGLPDFRYPEQVFNRLADLEEEFDRRSQEAFVIQERMTAIVAERLHLKPIAEAYFSKTPTMNVSARTSDGTIHYLVTMRDGAVCLNRLLPSYELFKQLTDEEVEAIENRVFTPSAHASLKKLVVDIKAGKKAKTAWKQLTTKSGNTWLVNEDGCEARWFDQIVDLSLPWGAAQAKYRDEALEVYETIACRPE